MSTALKTIGLLSPGEMGHSVARVLQGHGLEVITCLQGRSPRTRRLAQQAGIRDLASVAEVVRQADMVISIVVPGSVRQVGETVAQAMQEAGRGILFIDANSIAPSTARDIGRTIAGAGGSFVDASIIGSASAVESRATFYASGEHAPSFARLASYGLRIEIIGEEIGQASGLKMLYAGLTKGLTALSVELLLPAQALGLLERLMAKLEAEYPDIARFMQRRLLDIPFHATRRSQEMEELAQACRELGLPATMAQAGRDSLRAIGDLELRNHYSEDMAEQWDYRQVLHILGERLTGVGTTATG